MLLAGKFCAATTGLNELGKLYLSPFRMRRAGGKRKSDGCFIHNSWKQKKQTNMPYC